MDLGTGRSTREYLEEQAQVFVLCTSELSHTVENHIGGYTDDTTIYAVIPRPLSRLQVMESLNQDLAAINSRCLKWHMRPSPKKTKIMVINRSRTTDSGYCDLTRGGAELEEVMSLCIL